MKKIIDNRYELTTCTAIAVTADDTTRQNALYYHDTQDENHDGDGVIFGYNIDEITSESDINDLGESLSTDSSDLDTVEF